MLLRRADAPNALPPTGSDAHPGPNTLQSKRSLGLESAHAARSATVVVGFRCTPQSVPKRGMVRAIPNSTPHIQFNLILVSPVCLVLCCGILLVSCLNSRQNPEPRAHRDTGF
jgi:hypothetical protein